MLTIYVEIGELNSLTEKYEPLPVFNQKDDVILFFKFYDPKTSTLKYVCHLSFSTANKLSELFQWFFLC